jgi:hypothetical protein
MSELATPGINSARMFPRYKVGHSLCGLHLLDRVIEAYRRLLPGHITEGLAWHEHQDSPCSRFPASGPYFHKKKSVEPRAEGTIEGFKASRTSQFTGSPLVLAPL